MSIRNRMLKISAESVLSSLGAAAGGNTLSMNNPMMPPKCLIQEDIRQGGGRFDLVRKRGRSEVWNLFGQVCMNNYLAHISTLCRLDNI